MNVVCFLLGNSPASEFYMPTFRNTLFNLHRRLRTKNVKAKVISDSFSFSFKLDFC